METLSILWNSKPCSSFKNECLLHDCSIKYWCGKLPCPHCKEKYCPVCKNALINFGFSIKCGHQRTVCRECDIYRMSWKKVYVCVTCQTQYEI